MVDLSGADDLILITIAAAGSFICGPLAPIAFFILLFLLYWERDKQARKKSQRLLELARKYGRLPKGGGDTSSGASAMDDDDD